MTPNFQKLSALYFLPAAILAEVSAHAASLWAHNISAILDGTAMDDVERVAAVRELIGPDIAFRTTLRLR